MQAIACWELAIKRGSLGRALRTTLSPEDLLVLEAYAASLASTPMADIMRQQPMRQQPVRQQPMRRLPMRLIPMG